MSLKWDQQLATGMEDVDEQHKELIVIMNRLEAAVEANDESGSISEAVDGLNDYVLKHFRTEEGIMHSYGYPKMDKHLLEHNYFKKKMLRLNFKPDDAECAPGSVLDFLQRWIVHHICTEDKELGSFIRSAFQG